MVPSESVVGVFDLDNAAYGQRTREFLKSAEKAGQVVNAAEDIPRSFVLCIDGTKKTVYLSQLSSQTLQRRWENE